MKQRYRSLRIEGQKCFRISMLTLGALFLYSLKRPMQDNASRRVQPTLIGVFIIGALGLLILALIVLGSGRFFSKKEHFLLNFSTSINGLEVGAPVKFRGVRIGEVSAILLHFNKQDSLGSTPVLIEIEKSALKTDKGNVFNLGNEEILLAQINKGLRAKLTYQSYVTGRLFIELDYFSNTIEDTDVRRRMGYLRIPTIASDLGEIWKSLSDILEKLNHINWPGIGRRMESIAKTLDGGLKEVDFAKINSTFLEAGESFNEVLKSPALRSAITNMDKLSSSAQTELATLSQKMNTVLDQAKRVFGSLENTFSPNAAVGSELEQALSSIREAARAVRSLADFLERNPSALLAGKPMP
ncbi:MAG: hypothetical protein A2Y14_05630 [Verrucomicrobia bacterium GWF2_51_19]|nr:MAG: hypothetical protein A2Y14_05630 [Verrucomicrobia bacterium GWF2_51_19]